MISLELRKIYKHVLKGKAQISMDTDVKDNEIIVLTWIEQTKGAFKRVGTKELRSLKTLAIGVNRDRGALERIS